MYVDLSKLNTNIVGQSFKKQSVSSELIPSVSIFTARLLAIRNHIIATARLEH